MAPPGAAAAAAAARPILLPPRQRAQLVAGRQWALPVLLVAAHHVTVVLACHGQADAAGSRAGVAGLGAGARAGAARGAAAAPAAVARAVAAAAAAVTAAEGCRGLQVVHRC
jgi:hypothetical protein